MRLRPLKEHNQLLLAILTRLKQTNEPKDGVITITERSIYSNRYIFGPLQNKLGFMSSTEFKINCEWIDYLIETFPIAKVDAFLYLKVSSDRRSCSMTHAIITTHYIYYF